MFSGAQHRFLLAHIFSIMSPQSVYVLLFCLITLTGCDQSEHQRSPKIISFNSFSDGIGVNLDFSIPFLKIPIKQNVNFHPDGTLGLPKINFDPKSLAFGGALVIVTSLLASVFSKGITVQNHRYSRQDQYYVPDGLSDVANIILSKGQRCPARLACWAGRTANIRNLNAWKKITRNNLLSSMFNTTDVEYAYRVGRTGGDCGTFRPCPLNDYQFTQIIDNISSYKNTFISSNVDK